MMDPFMAGFTFVVVFALGVIVGRACRPSLSNGEMFDAIVASRLADINETSARMKLKRELQSAVDEIRPPSAE